MRRLFCLLAVAGALALGGCSDGNLTGPSTGSVTAPRLLNGQEPASNNGASRTAVKGQEPASNN